MASLFGEEPEIFGPAPSPPKRTTPTRVGATAAEEAPRKTSGKRKSAPRKAKSPKAPKVYDMTYFKRAAAVRCRRQAAGGAAKMAAGVRADPRCVEEEIRRLLEEHHMTASEATSHVTKRKAVRAASGERMMKNPRRRAIAMVRRDPVTGKLRSVAAHPELAVGNPSFEREVARIIATLEPELRGEGRSKEGFIWVKMSVSKIANMIERRHGAGGQVSKGGVPRASPSARARLVADIKAGRRGPLARKGSGLRSPRASPARSSPRRRTPRHSY